MYKINDDIAVDPAQGLMAVSLRDPRAVAMARQFPSDALRGTRDAGNGRFIVAMPWHDDSIRMLSNIGVDAVAASPLIANNKTLVEGKYTPMRHQLLTAAFCVVHPRVYVLSDPRVGKTGSLVLAMDYMQRNRLMCGGFLIITTLTTIFSVWEATIKSTFPNASVAIVHGKKRKAALAEPAEFYITNYESCRIDEKAFAEAVEARRIGGVVVDEVTHLGNPSSQRSKAIYRIINKYGSVERVIGVTGSPGDNSEAVFGMCKVINPTQLPCTTRTAWRDLTTIAFGPEPFMRRDRRETPDIIHKAMQPAVRFNKGDIIDLPPITTQDRFCTLTAEQRRVREDLRADCIALTETGETITAANGGVLYQKLMQTAQGYCITADGTAVELAHEPRTQTILDAVAETSRKVVIFCCYKAIIRLRIRELRAAGHTCEFIDGSVTGEERAKILHRFQSETNPRVLVAHPQTVSYGVELSAADTMIFDGPPPLGGFIYAQSLERLSSAKQTAESINIIRIIASPEEKRFFSTLDKGKELGTFISTLFESYKRGEL